MKKVRKKAKVKQAPSSHAYTHCLNCGTELKGSFCHACGQEATSKTPTVGAFVLEYLNNAIIWDSNCLQTIWTLIRRPGQLTKDYIAGKFVSQEHPLKLNMFLLFVFITLFVFFAGTEKMNNSVHSLTSSEGVQAGIQVEYMVKNDYAAKMMASPRDTVQILAPLFIAENYPEFFSCIETIEDTDGEGLDKWIAILPHVLIEDKFLVLESGYYRFNQEANLGKTEMELFHSVWSEMTDLTTRYFPMLVLFTSPLLALSLALVHRKNRRSRFDHFIFALHYTALLELLMICIYVLHLTVSPPAVVLNWVMIIGSCLYLTVAFRTAYDTTTWTKAALSALLTSLIYLLIGLMVFFVIFIIASVLAVQNVLIS